MVGAPRLLCLFALADFGYCFRKLTLSEDLAPEDLRSDNEGCHLLEDEAGCTASKDTRPAFFHSPCRWCCGNACVPGGNKCEPVQWLQGEPFHNGQGKTGLGEDTCPVAPASPQEEVVTRESLLPCPCTIWQHCSRIDLLPDGAPHGVACVASPHAIISFGHQVQCVPDRAGGLDYNCPDILSHMCNPDMECFQEPLGTCNNFDGCNGEYTLKSDAPEFCALSECTMAECCTPMGWWHETHVEHPVPLQSQAEMTCADQRARIAEPTMERLLTYTDGCGFNAGDVDFTSSQFELTGPGRAKFAADSCQEQKLLTCGAHDISGQARHVAARCGDPIFEAQMLPAGIFGTASALDAVWRDAHRDRPADDCGAMPEETAGLMPEYELPDESEQLTSAFAGLPADRPCPFSSEAVVGAPSPCAMQTCEGGLCCPAGLMTLRAGSYSKDYNVAFGNDGDERTIPCDIGPYNHGTVQIKCSWSGWITTTNHCRRWFR